MFVIAVTSCATGIAHSYMSAEAIKNECKARGYKCKVEIQGALGIENKLTDQEIETADLIIFANDVGISKVNRFDNYKAKIKKTTPHEVIKKPSIIFD